MRVGDVWMADFGDRRPFVVLSETRNDEFACVQIVEAAGVDLAGVAVEVSVGFNEGLPFDGVVRVAVADQGFVPCTWEATLPADALVEYVTTLPPHKVDEIAGVVLTGRTPSVPGTPAPE